MVVRTLRQLAALGVARGVVVTRPPKRAADGAIARLALVVILGVAMLFWPYGARCGPGLAAYLGAVGVLVGGGIWSAVWTWRHRTSRAHILSLLLILWGIVLGSIEILPRAGYAKPTEQHPAMWSCGA